MALSRYDDIATTRGEHSASKMCSKLRGTVNVCVIQYLLLAAWWEYVFPEYDVNYVECKPLQHWTLRDFSPEVFSGHRDFWKICVAFNRSVGFI